MADKVDLTWAGWSFFWFWFVGFFDSILWQAAPEVVLARERERERERGGPAAANYIFDASGHEL